MAEITWKEEIKFRVVSAAIWATATLFARLARFEVIGEEVILERWRAGQPNLIATWHGRSLMPIWWFGPRHWAALISLSRDGEYQNRIFKRFKWEVVRGSSGRGGARALAAAVKQLRKGATFAITPDGPRGPSHHVHPGVLFMSQKARCPIYPMGVSSYPRWFLPTWDRYQILKPFARAVIVYGEPLWVPAATTEAEMNELAAELARRICALETEADRRVAPEKRREVSTPIHTTDVPVPAKETPAEDEGESF